MRRVDLLTLGLVLSILVGIALRVVRFQDIPPGLYRDQAYNAMDAQETLKGNFRLFYSTNFGREPLFIWLTAFSLLIWGPSPLAARFPSLIAGIPTLFTLYGVTKELYGRRVAVWATAVLSVTVWHIHFSRVGFRAILVPLFSSLSVWLVARSLRTGRDWLLAMGGVAAGALIYTYISARAVVIPAVLFLLYVWWRHRSLHIPTLRQWMLFTLPAVVTMAPFFIYAATHWEEVFLRIQVAESVFTSPQPLRMLGNNVVGALGMFLIRGDFLSRHNVPFRPVFDPALGAMFCIGLWLSIQRFKNEYAAAFLLIWVPSMLIPTILTKDCPHFIRGIGILPFLTIFPALGLDWVWRKIASIRGEATASIAVLGILLISLLSTVRDYFYRYPTFPETCYRFECAGVEMASEINAYLEKGWTKGMVFVRDRPGRNDRQVFVQLQLWKDVVNAHYLIPDSPGFNVPGASEIESIPPQPDLPMVYYGWYNQYYPDFWLPDLHAWLPPHSLVQVSEGPWAITHQDWSPHPAYLKFVATPFHPPDHFLASFDEGLSLVSGCIVQEDERFTLRLIWHASQRVSQDYHVFIHYERNGHIIAQADGPFAAGYYPTSKWRAGDFFYDERVLFVPQILPEDRIWGGLYLLSTGERLPVVKAATEVQDNRVALLMKLCSQEVAQ